MARFMLVVLGLLAATTVQGQGIPGGYNAIDVNSESAKNAAQLGVSYLQSEVDDNCKLRLVRIIDAEEQVVAGTNTHVTFEVVDEDSSEDSPALDTTSKTSRCSAVVFTSLQGERSVVESSCDKAVCQSSDTGIPGGYNAIDVNSEAAKNAAQLGVSYLKSEVNDNCKLRLVQIIDAEEQVVAGRNTHVTFEVVSGRNLDEDGSEDTSALDTTSKTSRCSAVVFTSLQGQRTVVESSCDKAVCQSSDTGIPGGYNAIDVDSEAAKNAAQLGVSYLQSEVDDNCKLRLVQIIDAEEQVVAGRNTHVTFEVVSGRNLDEDGSEDTSALDTASKTSRCSVVVFTSLQGTRTVTESSCDGTLCKRQAS